METSEAKIKVCIYARVSTLLGQDVNNQIIPIQNFIQFKNYEIVKIYTDVGISGSKSKEQRPQLNELVKDAKDGQFSIVMIYALDRLGRDTRHLLNLIAEFKGYGVDLVSLRENLDLTTPIGRTVCSILASISQLERELISERIKVALATKKQMALERGEVFYVGKKPVINDEIISKCHELRSQKLSMREIALALNISKASVERSLKRNVSVPAKN
jgi:site-specific DNA recombinase